MHVPTYVYEQDLSNPQITIYNSYYLLKNCQIITYIRNVYKLEFILTLLDLDILSYCFIPTCI